MCKAAMGQQTSIPEPRLITLKQQPCQEKWPPGLGVHKNVTLRKTDFLEKKYWKLLLVSNSFFDKVW